MLLQNVMGQRTKGLTCYYYDKVNITGRAINFIVWGIFMDWFYLKFTADMGIVFV